MDENENLLSPANGELPQAPPPSDSTTVQAITQAKPNLPGLFRVKEISCSFIGKPLAALAQARTRGVTNQVTKDSITVGDTIIRLIKVKKDKNGNPIFLKPGAGEMKLLRYGVSALTEVNAQYSRKPTLRIYGDTKDFARACIKDPARGIDPRKMSTPKQQEKENKRAAKALENFIAKLGRNALALKAGEQFDFVTSVRGKEKSYSGLSILGAYEINSDVITLEFTQIAAEYFVHQPLTQTTRAYYAIDERKPNAMAIADVLSAHYGNDNNVLRNTEGVLKVENILKATSLPTVDELTGKGGKNKAGDTVKRKYHYRWVERIYEPFIEALEELKRINYIKSWEFCLSGKKKLDDKEHIVRYEQFISLYVKFELCGYNSHDDRMKLISEKKAKEIERSAKKRRKKSSKKPLESAKTETET